MQLVQQMAVSVTVSGTSQILFLVCRQFLRTPKYCREGGVHIFISPLQCEIPNLEIFEMVTFIYYI